MAGLLARERIIAPPGYNRWRVPLASVAIHLCIGSVYAWSIYNPPLTKVFGVVTSAADDWNLGEVVWIFTVAIVFLGLAAAVAGRWLETVGPRMLLGRWLHRRCGRHPYTSTLADLPWLRRDRRMRSRAWLCIAR